MAATIRRTIQSLRWPIVAFTASRASIARRPRVDQNGGGRAANSPGSRWYPTTSIFRGSVQSNRRAAWGPVCKRLEGVAGILLSDMRIPNADKAIIAQEKLTDYLLNPAHRRGATKARLLLACGYRADAWQILEADERIPCNAKRTAYRLPQRLAD